MLGPRAGAIAGTGALALWLSLIVALPVAAVLAKAASAGPSSVWAEVSSREAVAALELTVVTSLIVTAINAVMGTAIAWVLVRDRFRGRGLVDALIDLPLALPTVVAGLTLLAVYGPNSPVGVDVAFTRTAIVLALAFVTLPFVVRAVQPLLLEADREMEEAAASLGARPATVFRRVILPHLAPGIAAGAGLAFARCLGEFGSVVLISGNLPFRTEMAPVLIFGRIESDDLPGAASVSLVLLVASVALLVALRWIGARGKEA